MTISARLRAFWGWLQVLIAAIFVGLAGGYWFQRKKAVEAKAEAKAKAEVIKVEEAGRTGDIDAIDDAWRKHP